MNMKQGMTFLILRRDGVTVWPALCIFAVAGFLSVSSARAAVTQIANLAASSSGAAASANYYNAQGFKMSSTGGTISSLTLQLDNTSSSAVTYNVYLYSASSAGVPTGSATTLATGLSLSAGNNKQTLITLGSNPNLTASSYYAIAVESASGSFGWDYTTSSTQTGSGSFSGVSGLYYSSNGGSSWANTLSSGDYEMFNLQTVPEPINVALAVFGLVFVGGGIGRHYLARKSVSPIA
jgi:hypothetical protein